MSFSPTLNPTILKWLTTGAFSFLFKKWSEKVPRHTNIELLNNALYDLKRDLKSFEHNRMQHDDIALLYYQSFLTRNLYAMGCRGSSPGFEPNAEIHEIMRSSLQEVFKSALLAKKVAKSDVALKTYVPKLKKMREEVNQLGMSLDPLPSQENSPQLNF